MLEEIQSLGAHLVAISPQLPAESAVTAQKNGLSFHLLSDAGNGVARQFRLVFALPPALREVYQTLGIDLPAVNGDGSYELPLPATYVIDRDRTIRAVQVDADYVRRVEPEDVLHSLRTIRSGVS